MIETLITVAILCNNANWQISERCQAPVDMFVVEENGEAWGTLTNGIAFQQRNITNELGVRLQKFSFENAYWYVTDKGIIHADSDTQALSVYLAK